MCRTEIVGFYWLEPTVLDRRFFLLFMMVWCVVRHLLQKTDHPTGKPLRPARFDTDKTFIPMCDLLLCGVWMPWGLWIESVTMTLFCDLQYFTRARSITKATLWRETEGGGKISSSARASNQRLIPVSHVMSRSTGYRQNNGKLFTVFMVY